MSGDPPDSGGKPELGDETVELELTATEQLELARAAELSIAPLELMAPDPGHDAYLYGRTHRIDVISTITFAALVFSVAALFGWRALLKPPVEPAVATLSPVVIFPIPRAQESPAVVQVVNPFDPSEVFELPAQTTDAEAKDAIAKLLLQRAQERLQQGIDLGHVTHHRPLSVASVVPNDVVITKLSGSSGGPDDSLSLRAMSGIGE